MPEWFLNRYYYSIKSMCKTLTIGYIFSISLLWVGYDSYSSLIKNGYIIDYKHNMIFRGSDAIVPTYGVLICSILMTLFALYLTIYGFILIGKGKLTNKPVNYICGKCESVYEGQNVIGNICPKCGSVFEDLKGYYDRHPEKRGIS